MFGKFDEVALIAISALGLFGVLAVFSSSFGTKEVPMNRLERTLKGRRTPVINVVFPQFPFCHTRGALAGLFSVKLEVTLEYRLWRGLKWKCTVSLGDPIYGSGSDDARLLALLHLEQWLWTLASRLPAGSGFLLNGSSPDWMSFWVEAVNRGLRKPSDLRPGWTY